MKKACFSFVIILIFTLIILGISSIVAHSSDRSYSEAFKSSDIEVISNPKTPVPEPGKRKRLVFSEELTIGVSEGDEHYMFGETVIFNTDEKGNFYVTDWDSKRILKYDSKGKYLCTIGRKGQGPGEFQNISIARFDKEGHIYVTDIANRRISFFDTDGQFLRQINMPSVFEDLHVNSKGHFIATQTMGEETKSGMGYKIIYGVFDENFNLISEFYSWKWDYKPPEGRDMTSMAKFTAGIISKMAYRPHPVYVVAENDLIFFGFPDKYEIDVYSPEGNKIKTTAREYDPIKVGEKDKEYFQENWVKRFMQDRSEDYIKEAIRFISYPKYKPAYQGIALMKNGWLFVIVEFKENEYTLCDLFDEEGKYVGHFKADISPDFLFFKNGKAYSVATVDDYIYVKRYSYEIQEY